VGVHYRERKAEAQATLDLVRAEGGSGAIYYADVRRAEEVTGMVALFCRDHERLDAMICNAGVAASGLVLRQSMEEWDNIMATNLTGVLFCLQAAGRRMVKQRAGSIIVIGSYAAVQGATGQAAYAASKAGQLGLIKTAAQEWGSANVRVNLIFPGWHQTELAGDGLPEGETWDDHCLGRSPNLDEVARTVLHLAQLNDVSGQVWNLDSRLL
jgi:3-oxoacyl-[acyl-carrier protein] reductase